MNLAKRMSAGGAILNSLCPVLSCCIGVQQAVPVLCLPVTACSCKLCRVGTHIYAIAPGSRRQTVIEVSQSQKRRGVNGPFPYSDDAVWEIRSLLSVPRRVRLRDICLPPSLSKVAERITLYCCDNNDTECTAILSGLA
jgi:hypothetical protein